MAYSSNTSNSVSLADYISMNHDNIPLGHFLKFSPDNKRESMESTGNQEDGNNEMVVYEDANSQVIIICLFNFLSSYCYKLVLNKIINITYNHMMYKYIMILTITVISV